MRIRVLAALACGAALAVAGCGDEEGGEGDAPGTTTTIDALGRTETGSDAGRSRGSRVRRVRGKGYRYVLPESWAIGERVGRADTTANKIDPEGRVAKVVASVRVAIRAQAPGLTLQQTRILFRRQLQQLGSRRVEDRPNTTIDGEQAVVLTSQRPVGSVIARQESLGVIHEGRLFTIVLDAGDEDFDLARNDLTSILRSWRWR